MSGEDIKKCTDIFVKAYHTVYSEPWTMETGEKRITEIFNQARDLCFVLEIDSEICGFLAARGFFWYDGLRIWIEEIVIEERFRGQGYGTFLLKSLEERGNQKGVVGHSLISEKSSKAYKYYLNRGFSISSWIHLERI